MDAKKHRVLFVGAGSIGERHVRCFLATGRVDAGLCEPVDALRNTVAQRYGIGQAWSSVDDALSVAWDAALIATPAHVHIPLARQLAGQGIPVLIEKPLSISLDGVADLAASCAERNLLAAVSYNYRAHPALAAMKAALDDGRFGRIRQLYAVAGQDFAKYRPAYASVYFADPARGGGAIQDAMTHIINMGEWLAGPIDRVCADAAHRHLAEVSVEDTVHVIARHGEVMGAYLLNMYQKPNETSVTAVCERATVRFEVQHSRWRWLEEADGTWHDESFPLERDTWYVCNANAFLDALEGRAASLCSLDEGIRTLRTMLAVRASVQSHAWEAPCL